MNKTMQNTSKTGKESDTGSGTGDLMYLATNDVQNGDYQQSGMSTANNTAYGVKYTISKNKGKPVQYDESTMARIGVYAAANVRNVGGKAP